uniref:Ovule protein n=1 Tax=Haemonchus placei TaxID=6290 RepID=A0A0N4W7E0_HAEPC
LKKSLREGSILLEVRSTCLCCTVPIFFYRSNSLKYSVNMLSLVEELSIPHYSNSRR